MKYRMKHYLEYAAARFLCAVARGLPLRLALVLGWLIAWFYFHVLRFRRTKALERIAAVFGDRYSPAQRRRIAWISFRNLCFNAVEAARFQKLTEEQVKKMPLYGVIDEIFQMYRREGPMIFTTIHMGNWELGGVAGRAAGLPIFSLARRQKNPLTDRMLNQMREATGMEVLFTDSKVMQNVVRRMKKGGVFAILPDVSSRAEALSLDFLNGKANLSAGAARFAKATGCPIVPFVLMRRGWTQHVCKRLAPVYPDPACDRKTDRKRMMQELASQFDAEIQAHPEQYFWFNKRWVMTQYKGVRKHPQGS